MRRKRFCNATTRRGTLCQCKAIETPRGRWRCRLHGGLSTGPKTPEGRERIAAAQRARWAARRAGAAGNSGETAGTLPAASLLSNGEQYAASDTPEGIGAQTDQGVSELNMALEHA